MQRDEREEHASTSGEAGAPSRPPFPLERPTSASWREQALGKVPELRFVRDWLLASPDAPKFSPEARVVFDQTIDAHLKAAADAAKGGPIWKPSMMLAALTGSEVERVTSQLDAVEGELLRIAPTDYLHGEICNLVAHVQLHLRPQDPRRVRLESIAERVTRHDEARNGRLVPNGGRRRLALPRSRPAEASRAHAPVLTETDRQAVVSAVRAASSESRWKVSRLRSFRNVIVIAAVVLTLAVTGMTVFAFQRPDAIPVCFTPSNVVCTTSTTRVPQADSSSTDAGRSPAAQATADRVMRGVASGWDVAVVELVGLIAAAIAAAAAIRNVQGTSTPYSLPAALAVLKLPTGALTALLGLLLMRGDFVPGLSALDSSAQIIAWALVFGYAQQLLTRFVDHQAQSVLAGAAGNEKSLAPAPVVTHVPPPAEPEAAAPR